MVLVSVALFANTACDSSSSNEPEDKQDVATQPDQAEEEDTYVPPADLAVEPDTTDTPDTAIAVDTVEEPDTYVPEEDLVPQKADYPSGPFGVIPGTKIKNHSFYDPQANAVVKMEKLYKHTDKKVLVISSAAEWCGACKQEAYSLKSFYNEYSPQGLEIWYLLFEDKNAKPVDVASWQRWMNQINPNYPTYMDSDFQTGLYFQAAATPMNMVVDLSTMTIVYLVTGFDEVGMENAVKKVLGL